MAMLFQQLISYSFSENVDRHYGYTICLLQEIKILIYGTKKKTQKKTNKQTNKQTNLKIYSYLKNIPTNITAS
jgi:hypothetical protein